MNDINKNNHFLNIRPKWNRRWERSHQNLVVILIPKFGDYALGRWMMSKMKRPNYRLKLDDIGSFVWEHCDGSRSVEEIGEKLHDKFGEKVEPVHERLGLFLQSLEKSKSITWV